MSQRSSRVTAGEILGASAALCAILSALPLAGQSSQQSQQSVILGASGDVMIHLRVIAAAAASDQGFDHVFGALLRVIDPQEIAFANLETPLSMDREPVTGSPPILGAPAQAAAALARSGLDLMSVANNHAYDQFASGVVQTTNALHESGITPIGAGRDAQRALEPVLIERGGLRLAFLAVAEFVNGRPGSPTPPALVAQWQNLEEIESAVDRARAMADIVVLSIHWGRDFQARPRREHRRWAHRLIERGVDIILGHGPHLLHEVQRMESSRGDAVCAYSLGNLVSNQGMRYRARRRSYGIAHIATYHPGTRDGVWLRIPVQRDSDGHVHIGPLRATPLYTYNNYVRRFLRLEPEDIRIQRLADEPDVELRSERRAAIAAALGPAVALEL